MLLTNHINDIFQVKFGADDVPAAKPKPDGLLHCCNILNVRPNNCVYIGDSPSDG